MIMIPILLATCGSLRARFRCQISVQWWHPLSYSQNKPGSQRWRLRSTGVRNTQRNRPPYGDRQDPRAFISILLSWSSSWRGGAGIWYSRTSGWGSREVSSVSSNECLQDLYEVKNNISNVSESLLSQATQADFDVIFQEAFSRARYWSSGVCSASWLSWHPRHCSPTCSRGRNFERNFIQTTTEHNVALGERKFATIPSSFWCTWGLLGKILWNCPSEAFEIKEKKAIPPV